MMEVWNDTVWWVQLMYNLAWLVLPTLALAAVAFPLGRNVAKYFVKLWEYVRQLLDERTDPAIKHLAELSGKDPGEVSKFLVESGDSIADILKHAMEKVNKPL